MGGRPLTALAIAGVSEGWPRARTRSATIFRGGFDKLREAGVALLGGHTVQDQEIKFGYAVTGAIDPDAHLANAGAQPGDVLFLTKPLGTGIIGTAIKFDARARTPWRRRDRRRWTLESRRGRGAQALPADARARVHRRHRVRLIGHATEMAAASGCTVPITTRTGRCWRGRSISSTATRPAAAVRTCDYFGGGVAVAPGLDPRRVKLLY